MILDAVTKSLELLLGAAATTNAMPVVVDYVDMTTTTTLAGSSDTQSNGTTAVTILAAPAASTQRKVNSISVFNADTVASAVTIRLNNNTTLRNLISVTLQVGDTIGFTDVNGWYLLDSNGNLKSVQAASATAIATAIHNATNKTTPVGADEVGIWDSVSGLLNKVTYENWFSNVGNLTFVGTGNRITGDFSNATFANRVFFQTSTLNGSTALEVIPNGTNTASNIGVSSSSTDPANSSVGQLVMLGGSELRLQSGARGTGAYLSLTFFTSGTEQARIATNGTVTLGGASTAPALSVIPVASQNRNVTITGSNGGDPTIGVSAGLLNFGSAIAMTNQTVGTTVGAAGGASALPATPLGYLTTSINGTSCKIPYYN